MARALVLVEGQTEELFVKEVLRPHLAARGVYLEPTIVVTKLVKSGGSFKGGIVGYEKVHADLQRLSQDSSAKLITTMFDFYGLPEDFPGMSSKPAGTCYQRVAHVEEEFKKRFTDPRFHPYLSLHEFETLVFVDPARCGFVFANPAVVRALQQIKVDHAGVEEINEGKTTAPSKRILQLFPAWQKPLYGAVATLEIGLPALRAGCPHFDAWVTRLEALQ